MGDLSPNFSRAEFACKCGCGADAVDPELVMLLEQLRAALGRPIHITSGCRCPAHNQAEGGKGDSAHLTDLAAREYCQAADIEAATSGERFELVTAAINTGFRRIGIAKSFVHVDLDRSKPWNLIWLYGS